MALAFVSERLAVAHPANPALLDWALAEAERIADDQIYNGALAAIAERLAVADPADPTLFGRALAVADSIANGQARTGALAAVAERIAVMDPANPVLLDRAAAAAEMIRDDLVRSAVIPRIHALTREGMLDEMSRWRLRSLAASVDLLTVFVRHTKDEATAEGIGLAVLQVAAQTPAEI